MAPSVATLESGPGSVRGLAVDPEIRRNLGQVIYEVPVALPRARHGFGPALVLRYDGTVGTGSLGVGWTMAVPRIVRSTRHGVPTFTAADELEVRDVPGASGRLVAVAAQEYRVAAHGHGIRVTRRGDVFRLEDGGGQTWHFVGVSAPREAPDEPGEWLLQAVEDAHGQRATYRYAEQDGTHDLQSVTWGPNDAFGLAIAYVARPDPVVSFRAGRRQVLGRRAERIVVTAFGRELRAVTLAYDDARPLGRLNRIAASGLDGAGRMPAIDLTYAQATAPEEVVLQDTRYWRVGEHQTVLVDVDGDGIQDLMSFQDGAYMHNLGGRFEGPVPFTHAPAATMRNTRLVDIDHDGHVELLQNGNGGWDVWRLRDGGWAYDGIWPGTAFGSLSDSRMVLADLNGDGLPDRIVAGSGYLDVAYGSRTGMLPSQRVEPVHWAAAQPGSRSARVADVNGDGLVDLVGLGDRSFVVMLGRGDGTFEDQGWFDYPWGGRLIVPDSLAIADLDRDGLADLVYVGDRHVVWYPAAAGGRGASEARTIEPPLGAVGPVHLGDVNGNGSVDLVWASGHVVDISGPTSAGMLATIANGLGQTTSFAYESSSRLAVAAREAGEPWEHEIATPLPVCVRQSVTIAGSAVERVDAFDVRDAVWDHDEGEFAGFLGAWHLAVGERDDDSLLTVEHYAAGLGAERPLRGKVLRTIRWAGSSGTHLLDDIAEAWMTVLPAAEGFGGQIPADIARAVVYERYEGVYEGDADPVVRRIRHAFDSDGNAVLTEDSGRVDRAGDERVVRRTFARGERPWRRGVLTGERIEESDGRIVSQTRHRFRDELGAGPGPDGTDVDVGDGLLRRTEHWLAAEGRWVLHAAQDRDALGNVVHRVEGARHTWLTYDDLGLHPVTETLRPTPDTELVWQMAWDRHHGQLCRLAAPDGAVTEIAYDALGRPATRWDDTARPRETYAYDWTAPQPSTTTTLHDGAAGTRVTRSVYDGSGALRTTATRVAEDMWQIDGWREVDCRGRVTRTSVADYIGEAEMADTRALAGHAARLPAYQRRYDALGRLVAERLPTGAIRTATYLPHQQILVGPDQAPVTYDFDGQHRLVTTSRQVDGHDERADAEYDGAGRLTSLALQGGTVRHTFVYDTLGRLVASHTPEMGQRETRYSDAGQPTWHVNGAGEVITSRYDDVGRLVELAAVGGDSYIFHYDVPRFAFARRTKGRLSWVEQPTGEVFYSYDNAGLLARKTQQVFGETGWQDEAFSPGGALLLRCFDDSVCQQYQYDAYGMLVGIPDLWTARAYDARGDLLDEALDNGVTQTWQRNTLGQPTATTIATPAGTAVDLAATYTRFGALASVQDALARGIDHTASYRYDAAARLVAADLGPHAFTYAYDALQNLTTRAYAGPAPHDPSFGARSYDAAAPRQLRRAGSVDVAYDAAGRMVAVGGRRLAYDAFDRLREVTDPDGAVTSYAYDWEGQRVWSDGGGRGAPLRSFAPHLAARGERREHRVQLGERSLARLDSDAYGRDRRVLYFHPGLGAGTTLYTDEQGSVVDERAYEPFGLPLTESPGPDDRGAADRHVDYRTGWVDHGARWMAPELAAFTLPDPPTASPSPRAMRQPWDLNPYAFVRQNPLLFADPDGEAAVARCTEYGHEVFYIETAHDRALAAYDRPVERVVAPHEYLLGGWAASKVMRAGVAAWRAANFSDRALAFFSSPFARWSPVAAARASQLGPQINALDKWSQTAITKGQVLLSASPGEGQFFASGDALRDASGSMNRYYDLLQIPENPAFPLRKGITLYQAVSNFSAASSTAASNPQHGAGGGVQLFIRDWATHLEPFLCLPMEGSGK